MTARSTLHHVSGGTMGTPSTSFSPEAAPIVPVPRLRRRQPSLTDAKYSHSSTTVGEGGETTLPSNPTPLMVPMEWKNIELTSVQPSTETPQAAALSPRLIPNDDATPSSSLSLSPDDEEREVDANEGS